MAQAVAVAATLFSAYSSYQTGVTQRQQYDLQAKQATLEGERRAIQYQQRANDVKRRLMVTNATLAARSYAGGIDPFSGSPDIIRAANETAAGRDYVTLITDADSALRTGSLQSAIYKGAGAQAYQSGVFNAAAKLGMAPYQYSQLTTGKQEPAPVTDRSIYS